MAETACEDGLSLIFFGQEQVHVPFGTEYKNMDDTSMICTLLILYEAKS